MGGVVWSLCRAFLLVRDRATDVTNWGGELFTRTYTQLVPSFHVSGIHSVCLTSIVNMAV